MSQDHFHVTELYLLAAAFDAQVLFGLPDKKSYQLKGEEPFQLAHERLKEKGILTEDGKMTKTGAVIIQTLYDYFFSEKYVRIHNLMFAFRKPEDDEVIILAETEEATAYKLYVMAKPLVLQLLGDKLPLITREPQEKEKNFLKRELKHEEKDAINQLKAGADMVNIEIFQLQEKANSPKRYQQWLALTESDRLILIDTQKSKYYHTSQYWFMKLLFEALDFPYTEKEVR